MKRHWKIILPSLIMVAIWVFSAMNGDVSDAQSIPLANFLGLPNGFLRKAAHFVLFASLGALWYNYIRNSGVCKFTPAGAVMISLLLTALYAGIDELHQVFVPERAGMVQDVLLDSGAGLIGIIVFASIYYLTRSKKAKAERQKEVVVIWERNGKLVEKLKGKK